ncbi:Tab2/Atab2 family RNA-binding protein [Argonema antarcticum]|uniref:Tab2/Atab2 family RNA-binding protein n=1 Tax=Argonema antarcticum TaxID=2942763 RepID=UPI002010D7BF|nr:Tab2/Atab2 family RNA-binding protein [Argonema antarcticum]MCL1471080.1 Tab2/Atab2 family RNA-binding protein [Argonema antarcticum A004/B2]
MTIWQIDFYRRPLQDEVGSALWELLICDRSRSLTHSAFCPQSEASPHWIVCQLLILAGSYNNLPDLIQVFRPQSLGLIEATGKQLGIPVEATRRTYALKQWLEERAKQYASMEGYTGETYAPLAIEKPPPIPLPEKFWGERWRFATLSAGDLQETFTERLVPILEMPDFLLPINLGISSTVAVPGVVIDGGKRSMQIARWIQESHPVSLNYIQGTPDGLVLETGLNDRWVVATFADEEVAASAQMYEGRLLLSKKLHFLLVQPDDSGMTYTGFWLLRGED